MFSPSTPAHRQEQDTPLTIRNDRFTHRHAVSASDLLILPSSEASTKDALVKFSKAVKQNQQTSQLISMIDSPRSNQAIINLKYSQSDLKKQNYFSNDKGHPIKLKNTLNEIIKERNRIIRHELPVTKGAVRLVRLRLDKETIFS